MDSEFKAAVREIATDATLVKLRQDLATFTAEIFSRVGTELHEIGHIVGGDRVAGLSHHGSDEVVGVSLLLRIAGQLTGASSDLFASGRTYAAAALVRQLVEVEYLAWAFEARDSDAERWLRSTPEVRMNFFAPRKLRQAAGGKFRGKDYGYHCELGGHPVPGAWILLSDNVATGQLLLSDMLGHTGRIWDHLLDWAGKNPWAMTLTARREEMFNRYHEWQKIDKSKDLPPPP
jgi:hypothetical protein